MGAWPGLLMQSWHLRNGLRSPRTHLAMQNCLLRSKTNCASRQRSEPPGSGKLVCTFLGISSSQGMPRNHHSPILSCRKHKWRRVLLYQDRLFFPLHSGNKSASCRGVASGQRAAQPLKVSGATSEQPGHFRNVTTTNFPLPTEKIWVGHPGEHTD